MTWDYLTNSRIFAVDCLIDEKFFAGWIAILGFTSSVETLSTPDGDPVVSIIIPKELQRVGALQRFYHPIERIEFEIKHEFIRAA